MWKKIFSAVLLLSVTICAAVQAAIKNPADDENLILYYQHQGLESYLLKNSLRVNEKNSLKVITFDYIIFDSIQPANTRWNVKENMSLAYDESARKVYFFDEKGGLIFLNPNGTIAEGSGYAQGADLIYSLTFGKKFYICPTYLDADKNYILYADLGGQGAGLYIDKHTISIAEENSTSYTILIDTVEVPDADKGNTRIVNRYVHRYKFDVKNQTAYRYENFSDEWINLNPAITNVEDENFTYDVKVAEMAFYLATGQKFYGTFGEDFYKFLK